MKPILGHQKIEADILNDFQQRKLHHALIFSGVNGIGKFSFAKNLAQKITNNIADNNPDILLIKRPLNTKNEFKKDIPIDEIRKINDFIHLTASKSIYRVIVIDGIDYLNKNSSNALLKNLEEPPANIFFFLINHNLNRISDTIRSRCNIILFKPPVYKDYIDIISSNTLEVKDKELPILFEISGGSIAISIDFHNKNFLENYQEILHIITKNNQPNLISFIDKLLKKDDDLLMFEHLIFLFFNRSVKNLNNDLSEEFFNGEINLLNQFLQKNHSAEIFKKCDKIGDILLKVNNLNLDKKQSLINIFNIL